MQSTHALSGNAILAMTPSSFLVANSKSRSEYGLTIIEELINNQQLFNLEVGITNYHTHDSNRRELSPSIRCIGKVDIPLKYSKGSHGNQHRQSPTHHHQ